MVHVGRGRTVILNLVEVTPEWVMVSHVLDWPVLRGIPSQAFVVIVGVGSVHKVPPVE